MKKIRTVLTCIGIVCAMQSLAQNIIPLGTLPMQYNGGFAGEGEKARLITGGSVGAYSFAGRNYWNNYFASYDQFFPKLRSGIGLTFNASNHDYYYYSDHYDTRETFFQLSYSPKLSLKGKYTLAPFIDLSYDEHKYPIHHSSSATIVTGESASGRAGILFNTRKLYVGLTYYAFSTGTFPRISLLSRVRNNSWALQMGYTLQRFPESRFSFTPQFAFFLYKSIYYPDHYQFSFDLNLMFRYKKFIWSLNNTGLGLGYQNKTFRILLSQNLIYFSKINLQSSLALRYILN